MRLSVHRHAHAFLPQACKARDTATFSTRALMRHSIYLHIPFCTHRCAYCDFNTYAGQVTLIPAYVSALCRELEYIGERTPEDISVHTIFFGGGTPSLLSPDHVRLVLETIRTVFKVEDHTEVTLEANPGTLSATSLCLLRHAGINRISLGVQSANGEELRMLERTHNFGDVLVAFSAARKAGFDNLSTDLLFGLPEQDLATWQTTVRRVLELQPDHVSAYALTIEDGTPFGAWAQRGMLPIPDPDLAADMYEWLDEQLRLEGYLQYEISNWARDGHECLHNLQYWCAEPYLGFGAGAHGYAGCYRYSNVPGIQAYIDRLSPDAPSQGENNRSRAKSQSSMPTIEVAFPMSQAMMYSHRQSTEDDIADFMITGLRLTRRGIRTTEFQRRFGRELRDEFREEVEWLLQMGLLESIKMKTSSILTPSAIDREETSEVIRLSRRGRLLGNQVFKMFLRGDRSSQTHPGNLAEDSREPNSS
jgi:oxygen-independent coproporphyrinogen-3 oxidase